MLVLSRRQDEEILISGDVRMRIRVIRLSGNRVQLGFAADDGVTIQRAEIVLTEDSVPQGAVEIS